MYIGKKGISIAFLTFSGKVLQSKGRVVTENRISPPSIIGCRMYIYTNKNEPVAALDFDYNTVKKAGFSYNDSDDVVANHVLTYYDKSKGEYKTKDEIEERVRVYDCCGNTELFKFFLALYCQQFAKWYSASSSSQDFTFYTAGLMAQIVGYLSSRFLGLCSVHNFDIEVGERLGCSFGVCKEDIEFHCSIKFNTLNDMIIRVQVTRNAPRFGLVQIKVKNVLDMRKEDRSKVVHRVCAYILSTPDFVYALCPKLLTPFGLEGTFMVEARGLKFKAYETGFINATNVGNTRVQIEVGLQR